MTGPRRGPPDWSPHPRPPRLHWPLQWPFVLGLLALAGAVALVQLTLLGYAFRRLGLPPAWAYGLLVACLLGSAVNVPVARVRSRRALEPPRVVTFLGVRYVIPAPWVPAETVLAVNLGGALIPAGIALYLVVHDGLGLESLIAVGAVTLAVRLVARPVPGAGIVIPGLLPPILAAAAAILAGGPAPAATAYVAGVLGTLIGGDLLSLRRIRELGAPVASIGGAGTFDGVFLSGVIAVLLAGL